jgi:hypothetical protein
MLRRTRRRGEEGATLVFVVGFMVLSALVAGGLVTHISTNVGVRTTLDTARNREYAADGAVETAIAQVRYNMQNGFAIPQSAPGVASPTDTQPCAATELVQSLNGISVQVACTPFYVFTQSNLQLQRNVLFAACLPPGAGKSCTSPGVQTIIQAEVNFVSTDSIGRTSITVTKTNVDSWSVNS